MTNTTGATWMAGRDCSALISLSTPTIEAAAVDSPHRAAGSRWPLARSSEASLVATALQPKARPAPIIVVSACERPNALITYGSRLAQPSPTSTSVIVSSCEVCTVLRGGAHSATPITPATIRTIAMCS